MEFEFDPAKSEGNQAKHGIDFESAKALWEGTVVEIPAVTSDEPRTLAIGKLGGKFWTAVITRRAGGIRIISVRRARDRERKAYEENKN